MNEILMPTDICASMEDMQLHTCIEKALTCYSSGKEDTFVTLLEAGIKKCTTPYESYKEDLVRANILLSAFLANMAFKEHGELRTALEAKLENIFKALKGYKGSWDLNRQLIKGFTLMLTPSTAQKADTYFVNILKQKSNHILALIGRGCLAFDRQDYIGSLGYFKSVLMADPRGSADVRVGIAHCFWRMGDLSRARQFFEMAFKQNSRCNNARIGMAILQLNQGDERSYNEGLCLLKEAFHIDKHHSSILCNLASHYYSIGDHLMVLRLAGNAIMYTDVPELQSQLWYQVARSHHARGEYKLAMKYYMNTVAFDIKGFVLPCMGLAQLFLRDGDFDNAKIGLRHFLSFIPNESNAKQLLERIKVYERSNKSRKKLPEEDSSKAEECAEKNQQDVEGDGDQDSKESTAKDSRKRAATKELDTSLVKVPKSSSSSKSTSSNDDVNLGEGEITNP
ncbi:RNA polymerase-associated protein CTR9 homolog [Drosophila subpulchrella]|uniref:RNA polymerase-associated protein CTR9 homolog n=1 Tax=Drosophila subpulchrella TaxID=1486046 RepID=UPI0018A18307|nr:RNA polymerase-associated protein CTR9 homolog [Drosophila subpulchrella]